MNSKELVSAFIRRKQLIDSGINESRVIEGVFTPMLDVLLEHTIQNSLKIWKMRTRGAGVFFYLSYPLPAFSDTLATNLPVVPTHIYREALVPYNAVRNGLQKAGCDPDTLGLTETFLFDDFLDGFLDEAKRVYSNSTDSDQRSSIVDALTRILQQLFVLGVSIEAPKVIEIATLCEEIRKSEMAVLREYVTLVHESLELRKQLENEEHSRKKEERLIGISTYIYHNMKQLGLKIRNLSPEARFALLKMQVFDFERLAWTASRRYETKAVRDERLKKEELEKKAIAEREAEEKMRQEELELWRKVAQVECRHRYGHDNAVLSNDYQPDGHFYAGQEETEWLIYPDREDPGVSAVKHGARCLCHFHMVEEGRYIPRSYTPRQAA